MAHLSGDLSHRASAAAHTSALHAYLLDPLERAGSTFVQQFVVVLLATGSAGLVAGQQWAAAADVAGFAAIVSLLTSALSFGVPRLSAAADLGLRVAKTGLQSFLGVLAGDQLTGSVVHADWKAALAVAIPVMLTAALKGLAALAAPWSDGASLLPSTPVAYTDADAALYTVPAIAGGDLDALLAGTDADPGAPAPPAPPKGFPPA